MPTAQALAAGRTLAVEFLLKGQRQRTLWQGTMARWWLPVVAALCAVCWNHALKLRPEFPFSTLSLEPELLDLLHSHPRIQLTETEWYQFNATGVLVVRGAVPSAVVKRLRELLDEEPPVASPLFGDALTYVTSHAWAHYEGLRQLTASSLSASLAAQLLRPRFGIGDTEHSSVRLVNTVAYGIGRGQAGADWHTDEISYRPVRRQASSGAGGRGTLRDDRGVSVWIPLQRLETKGSTGGGLSVVPLNTASAHCYDDQNIDAINGRLRVQNADNFRGVAECARTLTQRGVSVGAMEPGDLVLFGRAVWHRTESPRHAFPNLIRWSYTERFVPEASYYSNAAEEHWLHDYITQPLCQAGLRDGDALGGHCFPSLPPPSLRGLALDGTNVPTSAGQHMPLSELLPKPTYSGTTSLERVTAITRRQVGQTMQFQRHLPIPEAAGKNSDSGRGSGRQSGELEAMLRSWGLAFFWTQLSECPVYLVLQPLLMRDWNVRASRQAGSGHLCAGCLARMSLFDLGVGFGASLISHPGATVIFWEVDSWSDSSGQEAGKATQLLSHYAWEVVELGVFLVEMMWLYWAHADAEGGVLLQRCGRYWFLARAAACSLCANSTSILVGLAINNWAPYLL